MTEFGRKGLRLLVCVVLATAGCGGASGRGVKSLVRDGKLTKARVACDEKPEEQKRACFVEIADCLVEMEDYYEATNYYELAEEKAKRRALLAKAAEQLVREGKPGPLAIAADLYAELGDEKAARQCRLDAAEACLKEGMDEHALDYFKKAGATEEEASRRVAEHAASEKKYLIAGQYYLKAGELDRAVSSFGAALESSDAAMRKSALVALFKASRDETLTWAKKLSSDPDPEVAKLADFFSRVIEGKRLRVALLTAAEHVDLPVTSVPAVGEIFNNAYVVPLQKRGPMMPSLEKIAREAAGKRRLAIEAVDLKEDELLSLVVEKGEYDLYVVTKITWRGKQAMPTYDGTQPPTTVDIEISYQVHVPVMGESKEVSVWVTHEESSEFGDDDERTEARAKSASEMIRRAKIKVVELEHVLKAFLGK